MLAFDNNLNNINKHLYEEEADYLLSVIFRICKRIFGDKKQYFKESNHQFITSFKNNIKGVVAIDEATDFSIWELNAMSNLAHPLFNSVTLSGDLMQRLTVSGISNWNDYIKNFPDTEVRDLKIAYRQTAKLLEIATEIYSWNVSSPADFKSHFPDDPLDPLPLMLVDKDDTKKQKWLVERIVEIQELYGTEFPSVAIFVKDDVEVVRLANALKEFDKLEEIGVDVVPCVQGQILGNKQSVRIYSIEYIKGLEFGAAFFHNLDDLSLHDDTLTNKYIYVGLSRANLFLGITMNEDFNEDLQFLSKHFVTGNWKDYSGKES
jgi:DNA helicase IV